MGNGRFRNNLKKQPALAKSFSCAVAGVPAVPLSLPSSTIDCMETAKIQEGAALYYLTFTVVYWLPVFISAEPCLTFTESLNYCQQQKSLRVNAFVIMPTHAHLIVFDADFDSTRLNQTITAMRQCTGRQLANFCHQKMPAVYGQVIGSPRRQDRANQFWQQSKHPVAIWSEDFWQTKFDYLHDNPRRKGLVHEAANWRFSSAAYWLRDQKEAADVVLTGIEW